MSRQAWSGPSSSRWPRAHAEPQPDSTRSRRSDSVRFGLTLPNRGVLFGVTTPEQMLRMAELADQSDLFQSVWVGDSLLGKPRMESIALLGGIAARTNRVRLGPACMASFPLRDPVLLAYQWASLDLLANGRTVMVGCTGIVPQEGGRIEAA